MEKLRVTGSKLSHLGVKVRFSDTPANPQPCAGTKRASYSQGEVALAFKDVLKERGPGEGYQHLLLETSSEPY